ncbi:MAG TPA: proline/glycine betaine ABC transporter permease [Geopsychrobacteraceae bacterium]|jgi:glycine betaine/proline transport system permease protein
MSMLNFDKKVIPLDEWVQTFVDWLVFNHRDIFQAIKAPIELCLKGFEWVFTGLPPALVILVFVVAAWRYAGKGVALFSFITLMLVGFLGLWEETMITLAMVISSVFFCALAGIPLGIMAGRSDRFELLLRPVLDAMQTIPPFVYLVPVVMLFSIGTVSGILATIVFALPPIVRLTSLGIRQVHPELIEAALAFGATSGQVLRKVQFPLALPSIMAGLNQTLMMALSMVVIAALIGAGGLGNPVVQGLNTLEIGLATIGGLAIVLLAMMLDRITQSFGKK